MSKTVQPTRVTFNDAQQRLTLFYKERLGWVLLNENKSDRLQRDSNPQALTP